jgi:hypothetical protein
MYCEFLAKEVTNISSKDKVIDMFRDIDLFRDEFE